MVLFVVPPSSQRALKPNLMSFTFPPPRMTLKLIDLPCFVEPENEPAFGVAAVAGMTMVAADTSPTAAESFGAKEEFKCAKTTGAWRSS